MRFNTAIDFIQASGGNIDHIHHTKLLPLGSDFQPEGTSPTLPSGSIWFRPNEGQAERLEYQGEDTKFQIRPGEGVANYLVTTTQALPLDFTFDETLIEDSRFVTLGAGLGLGGGDIIEFHVSGIYRITTSVRASNAGSDGAFTTSIADLDGSSSFLRGQNYIPSSSDGGNSHVFTSNVILLKEGARLQPHILGVGPTVVLEAYSFMVEFIRPVNRGNGSNVI